MFKISIFLQVFKSQKKLFQVDGIDDMLGLASEPKASRGQKRKAQGEAAKHVKKINTGSDEDEDEDDDEDVDETN